MKNKKYIILLSCLLMTLSLFSTGCKKEVELKDGAEVAVSVKGGKITATEYYENIKEKNVSTLVDMIDKALLEKKYPATEEEDTEVENQINQIKTNYTDESTLTTILTQYFGVNTLEELEDVLRLEYKRTKAVDDFIMENIKDDEIKKYYNENIFGQVKASHILIIPSVSDGATEDEIEEAEKEALKTAKEVIKKLKKGEDFAKLAKKYSQEDATAKNGGNLGYFDLDEMVTEFSDAVKKLDIDEYTKEPVKTSYGYHIILKTGEKEKASLKDSTKSIKEKIKDQRLAADPTLYYQTLIDFRTENKIKWNDTELEKRYNELMKQLLEAAATQNAQ